MFYPFTHPRKDPLEAVVQWDLIFKEARTHQIFFQQKSRSIEAAASQSGLPSLLGTL
jgi:hypothetical protein